MAPVLVTLNDLEGYSPVVGLFKCNPSNICTVFYQISTDSVLAQSLSDSWASCRMYMCMNFVHSCVWQLFLKNKRWDEMIQNLVRVWRRAMWGRPAVVPHGSAASQSASWDCTSHRATPPSPENTRGVRRCHPLMPRRSTPPTTCPARRRLRTARKHIIMAHKRFFTARRYARISRHCWLTASP